MLLKMTHMTVNNHSSGSIQLDTAGIYMTERLTPDTLKPDYLF